MYKTLQSSHGRHRRRFSFFTAECQQRSQNETLVLCISSLPLFRRRPSLTGILVHRPISTLLHPSASFTIDLKTCEVLCSDHVAEAQQHCRLPVSSSLFDHSGYYICDSAVLCCEPVPAALTTYVRF